MSAPDHLSYSTDHEWVAVDGDIATVGITEFAANALGDIVYFEQPSVGSTVSAGDVCGEIESTKSVSDLLSPLGGEITETNGALSDDAGVINTDPYGAGWLFKVRIDSGSDPAATLLDVTAYRQLLEGQSP